jgi:hypothetical protein
MKWAVDMLELRFEKWRRFPMGHHAALGLIEADGVREGLGQRANTPVAESTLQA